MAVERIFPAPVCGEDSCAIVTAVNGNCITPVKLQKCLTYITTGEAAAGLVLTNQAAYVLTKSQKALGFIWLLASTGHKLELPVEAAANFILTASAEHVLQYPRAASANIELTGAVLAAIQVFKEASAEFELSGLSAHLLEVFESASSFFVLNAAVSGAVTIDAEAAGIITLEAGTLFTATPKIEVDDFAITLEAEVAALTLSGLFAQASSGITLSADAVASLVLHIDGVAEGNIVLNAEAVGSTNTSIEGQAVANLVLNASSLLDEVLASGSLTYRSSFSQPDPIQHYTNTAVKDINGGNSYIYIPNGPNMTVITLDSNGDYVASNEVLVTAAFETNLGSPHQGTVIVGNTLYISGQNSSGEPMIVSVDITSGVPIGNPVLSGSVNIYNTPVNFLSGYPLASGNNLYYDGVNLILPLGNTQSYATVNTSLNHLSNTNLSETLQGITEQNSNLIRFRTSPGGSAVISNNTVAAAAAGCSAIFPVGSDKFITYTRSNSTVELFIIDIAGNITAADNLSLASASYGGVGLIDDSLELVYVVDELFSGSQEKVYDVSGGSFSLVSQGPVNPSSLNKNAAYSSDKKVLVTLDDGVCKIFDVTI